MPREESMENGMLFKEDDHIKVRENAISTIISADTAIEGRVISGNSIRLSGSVKGDITSKGIVIVGKGASVKGNITADSILVAGKVEGDLNSVNKTNIESTGEVYGDISTRKLLIDEESVFSGKCIMKRDNEDATGKKGERSLKRPDNGTAYDSPVTKDEDPAGEEIAYIDVDDLRGKRGKKSKGGRKHK